MGKGWERKLGNFESHAGAAETSANLFLRGDLVKPEYKRLSPFVSNTLAGVLHTHERTGWRGYWGVRSKASEAMGKDLMDDFVERGFRIAEKALAGEGLSKLPVFPDSYPDIAIPESVTLLESLKQTSAAEAAEIETWLKNREAAKP